MSSAVDQLLKAARFIEMQERQQQYKIGACTPPDSPVTAGGHYMIHNGDYTILTSNVGRSEELFLNEHHTVAPPLVVISSQNNNNINNNSNSNIHLHNNHNHQYNHNHNHHPTHSLSPHSYDASRSRSSSISSQINPITANGVHHALAGGEDSSQSSLNLSSASSGYISGSSANSSVGGCGGGTLNLSGLSTSTSTGTGTIINCLTTQQQPSIGININLPTIAGTTTATPTTPTQNNNQHLSSNNINLIINNVVSPTHSSINLSQHHQQQQQPQLLTTSRRRTISSNSNGAGTREVHNKLEKNRRAHLKECFEQLKKQLPNNQDEKKTSNLAILGNACRTIQSLKRKDREFEHELERLAKEKVAKQKRIINMRRELSPYMDRNDQSFTLPDNDVTMMGIRERFISETLSEPSSLPSSGRPRYSSTSSLSSAATATSPCTAGMPTQSAMSTVMQPHSPSSPTHRPNSSSPISITSASVPLSLVTTTTQSATKINNHTNYSNQSSASTIIDSSSMSSLKITPVSITNGPTTTTANNIGGFTHNGNHIAINFTTSDGIVSTPMTATSVAMPLNLNLATSKLSGQQENLQIINGTTNQTFNGIVNGNGAINCSTKVINGRNGVRQQQQHQIVDQQSILTTINKNLHHHQQMQQPHQIHHNYQHQPHKDIKDIVKVESLSSKHFSSDSNAVVDQQQSSTKVLKLINGLNGSIALASVVDKDNKLIPSGALTLSQVVVSPLPLRVIGQAPNSLATIELSNSNVGTQRNNNHNHHTTGAQLHKLLVSSNNNSNSNNSNGNNSNHNNSTTSSSTINCVSTTAAAIVTTSGGVGCVSKLSGVGNVSEFPRLPGGAELNILPAGTNGSSAHYRNNGKLAIVNNGYIKEFLNDSNSSIGRSVHMITTPINQSNISTSISSLTPIVVSQGGPNGTTNLAHIIATHASSQLGGKVVTTPLSVNGHLPIMGTTQYLNTAVVKPMVVTVAGGNNNNNNNNGTTTLTLPITTSVTSTSVNNTNNLNNSGNSCNNISGLNGEFLIKREN